MSTKQLLYFILSILLFSSCSENYSNGERIGLVTQFSRRGIIWKTYEGHLNITQTGMNSAAGFDFSVDGSKEDPKTVHLLDSAATYGWKVKLVYHQAIGTNILSSRVETNYFIDSVIVIDRSFSTHQNVQNQNITPSAIGGRVVDTIYVVITPDNPDYKKFFK